VRDVVSPRSAPWPALRSVASSGSTGTYPGLRWPRRLPSGSSGSMTRPLREEAVRLDLRYVENWSLAMDLLILAKTVRAVLGSSGAY